MVVVVRRCDADGRRLVAAAAARLLLLVMVVLAVRHDGRMLVAGTVPTVRRVAAAAGQTLVRDVRVAAGGGRRLVLVADRHDGRTGAGRQCDVGRGQRHRDDQTGSGGSRRGRRRRCGRDGRRRVLVVVVLWCVACVERSGIGGS